MYLDERLFVSMNIAFVHAYVCVNVCARVCACVCVRACVFVVQRVRFIKICC